MTDVLTIPPFLRRYTITGQELADTVGLMQLVTLQLKGYSESVSEETVQELGQAITMLQSKMSPSTKATTPEPEASPREEIDPASIRLSAVLKERVGMRIVEAIKEGHDTFARLRKALPVLHIEQEDMAMPDRVLKSALGHALRGELPGIRVVKVSPKRYGVEGLRNERWGR